MAQKESDAKPLKYDVQPSRDQGKEPPPKPEPMQGKMKLYKCRVLRLNVDRENSDLPIHVHCLDMHGNRPKQFFPNTDVILSGSEMDVLRNSAQEDYIEIPTNSGLYQSMNPLAAAEAQYPGFKARWGRTGLVVEKRTPNYAIDVLEVFEIPAQGLITPNIGRAILEGQDPEFLLQPKAVDGMAAA